MSVLLDELVVKADAAISAQGSAPSTLMQYRWAWSQFKKFCADGSADETVVTQDAVTAFVQFVATEHHEGRYKPWKARVLRKAALVLWEVATTGSYQWRLSRPTHPNDGLDVQFRPVQEQYEAWLTSQGLATATQDLYATVSRTVLARLPQDGVQEIGALSPAGLAAAVVFLGERYRPGSMRTVLSAIRVLCRFLEESGLRPGLSRAVPGHSARRTCPVSVLSPSDIDTLVDSPNPTTPAGLRDRAMLLLAARTGLRPVDIVNLRLSDIDWVRAQITLNQHKTGSTLALPLLADVGEAIADYLLHERPAAVACEQVFVRSQAPFTALAPSSGLHFVASRAFARTGASTSSGSGRGFRVLRASLATRMLEDGTVLPVISQALGHRSIDSAKHYLAGDAQRMRQCCLDFAGIAPRGVRS
ncbi:tyrosine-type recombinase/integrase [Dietzia maris]|uniref:tyrosine-type recombinase/integrase n=1 Tax=Dietzia maris TaxID=37915 RepID=UPI0037C795D0